jgi:tetratricopeptide (TPR) repeat protein
MKDSTQGKKRRLVTIVRVVILAVVLALGWRSIAQHSTVAGSIPNKPDVRGWNASFEEAINQAETTARGYLRPTAGLAALSRLYHANGFYNEALQCYEGLRQLQPGDARWPHLEACILAEFGRIDEARPLAEKAVSLAPDYTPARLRLGNLFLKANQPGPAVETYQQVLKQDPGDPYALLGLARCALARNDWTTARELLQQALKSHPDFIGGLSLMVTVSEHFGDQAAANRLRESIGKREFTDLPDPWFDGLLEDVYDPYRLSVAAVVANLAQNPAQAIHLLERATTLAPNAATYHRQLGLLLSHVPDYAGARQHLQSAVTLAPTDADSWLFLYQLMNLAGDKDAAAQALANGLAHCPESASLHLEQARRLNTAGFHEEAINEFRVAYQLQPSEAGALVELASVLFGVSRADEAVAALHEALRRQPGHPMALATLAFYSISSGDEAGALAWWDQVRLQPRTPPQTVNSLKDAFRKRFGRELP